jgi:dTDP-glucose pyrophosphorylase/CBS domain-containing protein
MKTSVPQSGDEVGPFLVPHTHSVREAMAQLEKTEEKIVFVIDSKAHLVGSVTDGDIRRWILSNGNLNERVDRVCNRQPYVAREGYSPEEVRETMLNDNFNCVPVVSAAGEVVRLLFWKRLFVGADKTRPKPRLNLPVVIMAGGRGSRLAPFTNVLPKPLIPIGDRTVIEVIIEQFLPYGLDKFYLSLHYKSRIIKAFFEELAPKYSVDYLMEKEPLGTAGCLRALYQPNQESIIVTNCDIVIKADFAELVAFHSTNNYDLTLVACTKDYHVPYGVCEIENGGSLLRITEKPKYNLLINTGMYLVRRDRLALIAEGERCDMPDFMRKIKEAGGRVGVFPVSENAWIDTGEWPEYKKSLNSLGRFGLAEGDQV